MAERVGLVDLAEQYEELGPELEEALLRVLRSGRYILGQEVEAFESEWAALCGSKHAIGVANGTDALYLGLRAAGIGPGDRVVVPAYTFIASYEAVVRCGAEPILADVGEDIANLDPDSVRRVAEAAGGARAVMAVHLYGIPCDVEALEAAVEPWEGFVIEDAAQAHAATWRGRAAGSLGKVAGFSFYPTKNLAAAGDAGAVTTSDEEVAGAVRQLRDHGRDDRYFHGRLGTNSRLDSLQAALLRIKSRRLPDWTRNRRRVAGWWREGLAPMESAGLVAQCRPPAGCEPSWHLYPIRIEEKKRAQTALQEAGVDFGEHYPVPLHQQPAISSRLSRKPSLPNSEAWARQILTLPCHPHVTESGVARASEVLRAAYGV